MTKRSTVYDKRLTSRGVRIGIGLALWAWALPGISGDWYTLALSGQALIVVDRGSMAVTRHVAQVTEVQIYASEKDMAGARTPVRRLDITLDIDCRRRQFRPVGFSAHDDQGGELLHWKADAGQALWQAPEAGSANAYLLAAVCGGNVDPARVRGSGDILQLQRQFVAAATGR